MKNNKWGFQKKMQSNPDFIDDNLQNSSKKFIKFFYNNIKFFF